MCEQKYLNAQLQTVRLSLLCVLDEGKCAHSFINNPFGRLFYGVFLGWVWFWVGLFGCLSLAWGVCIGFSMYGNFYTTMHVRRRLRGLDGLQDCEYSCLFGFFC